MQPALDLNPSARLRRLAGMVERTGPDGAWLAAGIRARLAGTVASLDPALGLVADGGVQPILAERNDRRNSALRAFAAHWLKDLAPKSRPGALAAELDAFDRRRWPALSRRPVLPPHLIGTRDGALAEIFQIGGVPLSEKQLRRVLSD